MILLSLLVKLTPLTIGITGLAIISFQQLFSLLPLALPDSIKGTIGGLWEFVYTSGTKPLPGLAILYVLVPWVGVMAAGYGFGLILLLEPKRRKRLCLQIGVSAIALFLMVGTIFVLLDQTSNDGPPFIFRLLNQKKYPASQLYLLMTLGPMIALLPVAEKAQGSIANALTIFGRVPLFYYLLHIPLIHLSALSVNYLRTGSFHQGWYEFAPGTFIPEGLRWGLPLLYIVFVVDLVILYLVCRWYVRYKANHSGNKLLTYL
jgi:uncharacterized membrane protein